MALDNRDVHKAPDGMPVRSSSRDLLHGALAVDELADGWVRPWRLLPGQRRALSSCMAWHPGLFSQMAQCTSGVTLSFETDATQVALEVRVDPEPQGTTAQLAFVDAMAGGTHAATVERALAAERDVAVPHDGISCDVDGMHLACRMPSQGEGLMRFELAHGGEGDGAPAPAVSSRHGSALPGLVPGRSVRIWLPALRGCEVRDVACNGSFIRPVASAQGLAGSLLVLGDSIAQGFVTDDPALSWPALVAGGLGCDLVNQGIGGQVFQETSLAGLASAGTPSYVVVALGANYRFERCGASLVSGDVVAYLRHVARAWPEVPCLVVTPIWHAERAWPSHPGSCWEDVPGIITHEVARHANLYLLDGRGVMDANRLLLADGFDHPNVRGSEQVADRILAALGHKARVRDAGAAAAAGGHGTGARGQITMATGVATTRASRQNAPGASRPATARKGRPARPSDDRHESGGPDAMTGQPGEQLRLV